MKLAKITTIPIPLPAAFGEARTVQGAAVREADGALLITSTGRFKRFPLGTEYILIREGSGNFKWSRGELPFAAGDAFVAEGLEEYDFYGTGTFLIVKG